MVHQTTSLIAAVIYSVIIGFSDRVGIFSLLFPIALILLFYRSLFSALKKLLALNIFIVLVVVSLLLNNDPNTALLIFLRSNLVLLSVLLLFANDSALSIAMAFSKLYMPPKLTAVIFFSAKMIELIRLEFARFRKTLRLRGFRLATNLLSYKLIAGFVGLLFIKAFERAAALQKTMLLRSFDGKIRSIEEKQRMSVKEIALIAASVAAIIGIWI
ncbi:MAG: energy-coupling factor transporter transmembrane protein EcfT [Helicobacteraceae bacterium]|jgi:cobalt/nickel transport system permease protein|nr:energy-coupling factor transporter transmembrane protein EcfT [Helicobacteraceae bacterium]